MLGRVVKLQPPGYAPGLRRRKGLIQRGFAMGVQIVQDHPDHRHIGVVHVHQLLHHPGPIHLGPLVRHRHSPPPLQGREQHEQVAHPVSLVFVIVGQGRSGPRRERCAGLFHLLLAGLVQPFDKLRTPAPRCRRTGDGRPPARPPWRRRTRRWPWAGCTSIASAKAWPRFFSV